MTEKPGIKKVVRYRPRVFITILISPRVKKVIGRSSIFMTGFKMSSNIAKIKATFMIVSIFGEKERFFQISFSITRAKAIKRVYLSIFFMC